LNNFINAFFLEEIPGLEYWEFATAYSTAYSTAVSNIVIAASIVRLVSSIYVSILVFPSYNLHFYNSDVF